MAALGALLLTACASSPPQRIGAPFDLSRARALLERGTNEIVGNALLRLSSGGAIGCIGESVTLYPATRYAREWAHFTYDTVEPTRNLPADLAYRPQSAGPVNLVVDQLFLDTSRSVPCDVEGNFRFENVGDGEFYVVARIVWQPQIWDEYHFFYHKNYENLQGTLMKKVRLHGGEKATVNLRGTLPNSRYTFW